MKCVIEFSQPFQRFQVQNALSNVNLPTAGALSVRSSPRWDDIGVQADSKLDTIDAISIDGFTDWVEMAAFVQSLPAGAFARVARISFSV